METVQIEMVSSFPGGHAGLLAVALATHAVVGYTLGVLLFDRPLAGVLGGLAADADLLFPAVLGWPFVHRGITHTLLAAAVATAIVAHRGRATAGAFGISYASHLLIDTTTPQGVPYLYPLTRESFSVDLGVTGHSPFSTVVLIGCCLLALWFHRRKAPECSA